MGAGTAERLRSERARAEREMEGRHRDRKGPAERRAEQDSSRANGCYTGDWGPALLITHLLAHSLTEASLPWAQRYSCWSGDSSLSTGEE